MLDGVLIAYILEFVRTGSSCRCKFTGDRVSFCALGPLHDSTPIKV